MAIQGFLFAEWWLDGSANLRVAAVSILVLTVLTHFILKKSISGISVAQKDAPEPPAWPVIGHLHLFGKLPHQILMNLARQYGPVMSLRLGAIRAVVASDAQMAEEFLKTQDAVWAARPPTKFTEIFLYNIYSDLESQPKNDLLRKMRRIYVSELFSPAHFEKQKSQRHETVMYLLNSVLASHRANELIDVYAAMSDMNCYQLTKLFFGKRVQSKFDPEKKTLAQIIHEVLNSDFFTLGECFPWLKGLHLDGVEAKLKKLHSEFDAHISGLLEERRRQLLEGDDDSTDFSRSLLSLLNKEDGNGLTYNQIKAAISDLYFGGTETSASLVTFTIAELMRHPEIKQKLVTELDGVIGHERLVNESDLANLHYLKMVIKECMRLHPPVPLLLPHESTAPSVVAGYHIPANTRLLVNVYAIHRDPKSWNDPLVFKPERFSDSSVDPRGKHFELLPFGSGRRQCPALIMGFTMTQLSLGRLFHSFDITLPPGMTPEDRDITEKTGAATSLVNPVRVAMSPRLPHKLYGM